MSGPALDALISGLVVDVSGRSTVLLGGVLLASLALRHRASGRHAVLALGLAAVPVTLLQVAWMP